jgi:hypothetical protein
MENSNITSLLSQLFFAYISLVAFIVSIGKPIFKNHDNFFNRPEIILAAGYFFVANSLGSKTLAFYAVILYYVTTIITDNVIDTYNNVFGSLSPLVIKFAEYFGFIEVEDNFDLDNDDSDSEF